MLVFIQSYVDRGGNERTFEVQAGASTIPHTYEDFEDNTFGSGYRGGTVAIGVTDEAYVHRFVSSGIGSIRKGCLQWCQCIYSI